MGVCINMKSKDYYIRMYLDKVRNEVPEPNRSLILHFYKHCKVQGLTDGRILEYIRCIYRIAKVLNKDFEKADDKDITNVLFSIKSVKSKKRGSKIIMEPYSFNYVLQFKLTLKKFYKWLNGNERYPPCVKSIICKSQRGYTVKQEHILKPEEIKRMAECCDNPRDRALVQVAFESGARCIELLNLKRKHVKFDEYGAVLCIRTAKRDGNPERLVRIVFSAPALASWLAIHGDKSPDASVWIGIGNKSKGKPVGRDSLSHAIKKAAMRAGIDRKVWLHLLRHSRCTMVSSKMSDAVMRKVFGWSDKSDMPSHYTHLTDEHVDDAILRMYGIKKIDVKGNEELRAVVCPRCGLKNSPSNYCGACGFALNERAALEGLERRKKGDKIMNLGTRYPELMEVLERIMRKERI